MALIDKNPDAIVTINELQYQVNIKNHFKIFIFYSKDFNTLKDYGMI
jgi:hypothetical protein